MTGIYIHIPFCKSKCPYCDFYSFTPEEKQKDSYLKAVLFCLQKYSSEISDEIDTVYFGGGTPSFFGGERIKEIISFIKNNYKLKSPEITVECNPSSVDEDLAFHLAAAGVNRISMGMQSAVHKERQSLGRASGKDKITECIRLFKSHGIDNISLDLMLGVPFQTQESLSESLEFIASADIKHISAYMLKIEEGTPFYSLQQNLTLPDEDEVCDMYLQAVDFLKDKGFMQYEISNFAKEGYESRHNLKYWHCEEYLGIGPSAHSFLHGKRFYFPRDFESFIFNPSPCPDGEGGSEEEYIMLALRLSEGLQNKLYKKRFHKDIDKSIFKKARYFEDKGLLTVNEDSICLNEKGFLLSNTIISELIGVD
ncbi:MAG: radical SAM family heme chaperone HemW [Acutalibacteraceae bacterium]|nr:radical SAM family heme chaperone HemW [Acutalibacteraceae bacterium]